MIPLRDNIPSQTVPFVNYLLIAACTVVFLLQLSVGDQEASLMEQYGMIPARVRNPDAQIKLLGRGYVQSEDGVRLIDFTRPAAPSAVPPLLTLLTCIFLHGGWMHFLGNVWFLWIFGDNVEDRFGHGRYLLFYLGSGIAASVAHLLSAPDSLVPTIGASGAIAGVMGAYFVLYPKALVEAVVPIFILIQIMVLPAWLFLGVWFAMQFFNGTFAIGTTSSGGVAWWAHIGGFVVGWLFAGVLDRRKKLRPKVDQRRQGRERVQIYRVRRDSPWR